MKHILGLLLVVLGVGAIVYLKYRNAKRSSDENDQQADVTTLFDGEK
jgi:hypothetical protein